MNKLLSLIAMVCCLAPSVHAETVLNDAEIAAVVVSANTSEVNAGTVAQNAAASGEVRGFAQQMVTDHRAMNKEAAALTDKLGLKPAENEISRKITADSELSMRKLKGLKGKDFDRAYVKDQVHAHQMVLDTITNTLLPRAQNAELKAMLQKAQPKVQAHLEHAQQMVQKLQ